MLAGRLVQASTRGNGTIGDVTRNVKTIKAIPQLTEPLTIEVRGEIYMPKRVLPL